MVSLLLTISKVIVFLLLPFWIAQAQNTGQECAAINTACLISEFAIYPDTNSDSLPISRAPINISTFEGRASVQSIGGASTYYYEVTPALYYSAANFTVGIASANFHSYGGYPPLGVRHAIESSLISSASSTMVGINVTGYVYLPNNSNCSCSFNYEVQLISATTVNVLGDPQFHGLRGQSYQIHGIDGAVYNLISTHDYAVNSRFAFLTGPRSCPIMPSRGSKSIACWSHDGSYLSNIAIVTSAGEKFEAMSGPGTKGFTRVEFNGRELNVGNELQFSQGTISYNTTHELAIHIGVFNIDVENIDGFVNLRSVHVDPSSWMELAKHDGTHGLLGQTWRNKIYKGQKVPTIEGDVDDYVIGDDDIYGTDFVFNRLVSE